MRTSVANWAGIWASVIAVGKKEIEASNKRGIGFDTVWHQSDHKGLRKSGKHLAKWQTCHACSVVPSCRQQPTAPCLEQPTGLICVQNGDTSDSVTSFQVLQGLFRFFTVLFSPACSVSTRHFLLGPIKSCQALAFPVATGNSDNRSAHQQIEPSASQRLKKITNNTTYLFEYRDDC